MNDKKIIIYTDGGSRGNPGPSALGVYIRDSMGNDLAEIGIRLGIRTNNFAEYSAIDEGLSWVMINRSEIGNISEINFFMDSNLAASQLNGIYRIKNADIREIVFRIRQKEAELGIKITYSFVPREQNKVADRLVNMALDNKI